MAPPAKFEPPPASHPQPATGTERLPRYPARLILGHQSLDLSRAAPPPSPAHNHTSCAHASSSKKLRPPGKMVCPDACVARVARKYGVNANQVFQWRTLYRKGGLGGTPMTPVK